MKAQMFLLTTCLSLAAADLGVISPRHGIMLNAETTRPDFQHFQVELKPADATNIVTLTITNSLLTIDDLARLPSGRVVMGLKSYFWDGSVSDLAIYTFDLRRADPPAPSAARAVISAGSDEPKSLINEMARLRQSDAVPEPPMPSYADITVSIDTNRMMFFRAVTDTNAPQSLPQGTNQTYAEYLDWLADRKGKRRNE